MSHADFDVDARVTIGPAAQVVDLTAGQPGPAQDTRTASANKTDVSSPLTQRDPQPGPICPGDANCDGCIDARDAAMMTQNFGTRRPDWTHGDFNADGAVDTLDFNVLAAHCQPQQPPTDSPATPNDAGVGVSPM